MCWAQRGSLTAPWMAHDYSISSSCSDSILCSIRLVNRDAEDLVLCLRQLFPCYCTIHFETSAAWTPIAVIRVTPKINCNFILVYIFDELSTSHRKEDHPPFPKIRGPDPTAIIRVTLTQQRQLCPRVAFSTDMLHFQPKGDYPPFRRFETAL